MQNKRDLEKAKEENQKLLSEQAPPKKVNKDEKKEIKTSLEADIRIFFEKKEYLK